LDAPITVTVLTPGDSIRLVQSWTPAGLFLFGWLLAPTLGRHEVLFRSGDLSQVGYVDAVSGPPASMLAESPLDQNIVAAFDVYPPMMRVRIVDAQGRPSPNVRIDWTVTRTATGAAGEPPLCSWAATTTTDSDGRTSWFACHTEPSPYLLGAIHQYLSPGVFTLTARYQNLSVTFTIRAQPR
jgi:hypothetical protein